MLKYSCVLIVQLDRTLASGAKGRGFESLSEHQNCKNGGIGRRATLRG